MVFMKDKLGVHHFRQLRVPLTQIYPDGKKMR